jgi:hypothetical protein
MHSIQTSGVLAISTVGLGIATIGLYRAGEKQIAVAKQAAEAAEKAALAAELGARASVWVELPCLYISRIDAIDEEGDWTEHERLKPDHAYTIHVIFSNVGRSAAAVTNVTVQFGVFGKLPFPPRYPSRTEFPTVIEPKKDFAACPLVATVLSESDASAIADGSKYLWLWGYIRFEDFMESEHEIGFLGRWHADGNCFLEHTAKRYTYSTTSFTNGRTCACAGTGREGNHRRIRVAQTCGRQWRRLPIVPRSRGDRRRPLEGGPI